MKYQLVTIALSLLLSACSVWSKTETDGPPSRSVNVRKIKNAVPKVEAKSRYGNPSTYKVFGKRYHVLKSAKHYKKRGFASWYGTKFHKKRTSSGEPYDMFAMTAAHKTLPLPTYAKVTNLNNGKQIIVKINDRGPFHEGRIIDLSYVAAKKLGITAHGTGMVEVEAIDPRKHLAPVVEVASPSASPQLYLQVGAFSEKANAENLAASIKTLVQQQVTVQTEQRSSHAIYRVQIGPLAGVGANDKVVSRLKQAGLPSPVTVIK